MSAARRFGSAGSDLYGIALSSNSPDPLAELVARVLGLPDV
jgi:hypothetical protein